jgi:hypothetical protein
MIVAESEGTPMDIEYKKQEVDKK